MSLHLPRLTSGDIQVMSAWNKAMNAIEAQFDSLTETVNRIRRLNSHTVPTTILSATEDGATVTIKVLDHVRVYGDGTTVNITGNATDGAGLLPATWYGCFYTDTALSDETPAFVFTQTLSQAVAAAADGRHGCGSILTPALGSGDTIESGGAYPGGAAPVGGELL